MALRDVAEQLAVPRHQHPALLRAQEGDRGLRIELVDGPGADLRLNLKLSRLRDHVHGLSGDREAGIGVSEDRSLFHEAVISRGVGFSRPTAELYCRPHQ